MYGGTISNGTTTNSRGGNIYVAKDGIINISGGTVTGGTAQSGKDIYLDQSVATISGVPVLGSLDVDRATLDVSDLAVEAPIDLILHQAGPFATASADKTAMFTCEHTLQYNAQSQELYTYLAAVVGNDTYRAFTVQDAIDHVGKSYVTLLADTDEDLTVAENLYLDLNGFDVNGTVTVAEGKTLYGMDASTNDYDCADGYGKIAKVEGNVAVHHKNDKTGAILRYVTVTEEDGISFHRIYLGVTKLTLRTESNGFGYKAVFYADEKAQALLNADDAFGFRLSLGDSTAVKTAGKALASFQSGKEVSLLLKNFDIAAYGDTDVNATVYLKLEDGTVIESSKYSYSMKDMLETLNGAFADMSATQQEALKTFCADNAAAMEGWAIENITATEEPAPEPEVPEV